MKFKQIISFPDLSFLHLSSPLFTSKWSKISHIRNTTTETSQALENIFSLSLHLTTLCYAEKKLPYMTIIILKTFLMEFSTSGIFSSATHNTKTVFNNTFGYIN